jgi:predicted metalloprotease
MRLDESEQDSVEDRRGESGGFGGGGFGLPMGGGLGIGTIVILGLLGWALGIDPRILIGGAEILSSGHHTQLPHQGPPRQVSKPSDDIGRFVTFVSGNVNREWADIFKEDGRTYVRPVVVLYHDRTDAACGGAQSAMGPFYCPQDKKIYLDTSFFKEIENRFRGCEVGSKACHFAQAYVIGHEIGHHVQNQLEILPDIQARQQRLRVQGDQAGANRLQVNVELQADCFAGMWARHENDRLQQAGKPALVEPGDVEAALQTASAIGDDTLQRKTTGRVMPDSFTHGSAADRKLWFTRGFQGSSVGACNTFKERGM